MSHSEPTVSLYLLGPPRIERAGGAASLKYNRARALLAYLALEPGFHTRDSLAELFWPNEPTTQGRDKLKRMLFELREALGDHCVEGDRYVVRLAPVSTVWVDAIAFEADTDPAIPLPNELTADPAADAKVNPTANPTANPASPASAARSGTEADPAIPSWQDALDRCARAVELYRGPLLQGLRIDDAPDFEIWLDGQREAYVRRLVLALSRLARGRAQEKRTVDAVRYARRLVDIAPHHEPGWQLLIDLLVQTGRRDEALHELDRCRRALARELDAEPHPTTLALVEHFAEARPERVLGGATEMERAQPGVSTLVHARDTAEPGTGEARGPSGPHGPHGPISPASVPRAHARLAMGVAHLVHGRMAKALAAFEATLVAQPESVVDLTFGADARAMALSLLSITQWRTGHQSTAIDSSRRALDRARRVRDPHTLAYALVTAGVLDQLRGEPDHTLANASELLELVEQHRMPNWRLVATVLSGWAVASLGDPDGITDAEAAADALNATMGSIGTMLLGMLRSREP